MRAGMASRWAPPLQPPSTAGRAEEEAEEEEEEAEKAEEAEEAREIAERWPRDGRDVAEVQRWLDQAKLLGPARAINYLLITY